MRQFVTYSGRHKAVLLVLLCLGIGTCDKQITVDTPLVAPRINTSSLPDAIVGESYSQTLSATGGDGNYTWSLGSDTLPAGLSLSSTSGRISGEPTTVGNSTFTVEVTSVGLKDTRQLDIEVEYGPPVITTTELMTGTIGQSYADTLKATGGDNTYTWTHTGQLPDGMELTASGVLTGRIRITGNWPLKILATSVGRTSEKSLTLYAEHPDVAILTTALPAAEVEVAYTRSLAAQGGDGEYIWSLESGALPQGLSLSDTTGVISGTPTSTDTTTFVVSVTSGERSADAVFDMSVVAGPLSITTSSLPAGEVGANYDQTLEVTGGDGTNYEWELAAGLGTLPQGLGLSNSGSITGTPIGSGTNYFTVLVKSANQTANQSLAITIVDSLSISTDSLPDATVGQLYSQVLSAAGGEGSGSYTWTVGAGVLPAGLSLSSAGAITGTPTSGGTNSFLVTVTSTGISTSTALTITVNDPLLIATSELSNGVAGSTYEQTLQASGADGNYSWSMLNGSLPIGLSLSSSGVISGTPTVAGTSSFSIQVTSGGQTASKSLSLQIVEGLLITTASLADAIVGVAYTQSLSATGGTGTYTWTTAGGDLPAGLTLSASGEISGTPTAAGTNGFTVRVSTDGQTTTKALSIVVNEELLISTTTLANGVANLEYKDSLEATGADGSYSWSLSSGDLPGGISLSSAGVISGTPTASGTSNFTVQVSSAGQTATKALSIVVSEGLTITTASLATGTVGTTYSQSLAAQSGDGNYTWSLPSGSLPSGVSMSSAGVISGTPTASGTSNFTVQVSSAGQTATKELLILVNDTLSVSSSEVRPQGTVGNTYTDTLNVTGGDGSYTWSVLDGTLPAGLDLYAQGVISGTPTASGTSTFTAQVTSAGQTTSKAFSITVVEQLIISTASLPNASIGVAYSDTLTATAGDGNYVWSVSSDTLPAGLSLSAQGVISGTPTASGTSNFTIQVTSAGQTATKSLSILVYETLSITSEVMRQASINNAYTDTLEAAGGDGTYNWSLSSGSLPDGLTMSAAGVILGTPTATSTSSFNVQVSSAGQAVSGAVSIEVIEIFPVPIISSNSALTSGIVGQAYSYTLAATGGDGSYSWSLQTGSLPTGLDLSSAGIISGTPTAADTASFNVRVSSAAQSADQTFTLTIGPAVSIATSALPDAKVNTAYSHTLSATGGDGSYSWFLASGSLPGGLSLSSAGTISGTATATDTASFSVSTVSAGDTATATLSLAVTTVGENEIPFGGTLTGLSGGNDFPVWTVEVPAGTPQLVIELTGGSVGYYEPYLYVAQGTSVGTSSSQYDCRDSAYPGRCVFENPTAGTWSIMVTATSNYSGVKLAVNPEAQTLAFGGTLTGLSGGNDFPVWTMEVPAGTPQLVIELTGGILGYYEPYLYVAQGTSVGTSSSQYDCRDSAYPGRCVFENPTAGTWSIMVTATSNYSGVKLAVNPEAQTLAFGGTLTGLSGGNDFPVWTMEVPAGTPQLVIELTGGSVGYYEPYLYVAQGTSVGTSSSQYDCRDSAYPGRCVFENPAAGTWSIMVTATSNYSGVKLAVNPEAQTLAFGGTLTGLSGGNDFPVWTMEVPAGTPQLVIELTGGIPGYYEPYLYVAQGTSVGTSSSQYDCRDSAYPGRCVFENPTAGTWSIMVTATSNYSGVKLAVNPEAQTLAFGGTLTGLSGGNDFPVWTMEVPAGTPQLVIELTGGIPGYYEPYLYVAQGTSVGTSSSQYDCRDSAYPGRCVFENPTAGTWSIMVTATSNYSGVKLAVNPEAQTLAFGSTLTGLSGGNDFPVWTTEVPAGTPQLVIELTGGVLGYYEPYLYVAQGASVGTSSSQYDCRDSAYPGRCVFENPAAGTWSIMVTATSNYSGVKLAVNPN